MQEGRDGRGGLLFVQCQKVSLKAYIQVALCGQKRLDLNMYKQIHTHRQQQLMKREAMNLKESREGYMGGRKGTGKNAVVN